MKDTPKILIALIIIAVIGTQSCTNRLSKLDKFMGEWKRIDKTEEIWHIKKQDDAILIIEEKDTVVARYDKNSDALKCWVFLSQTVVTYNEKNGHLLLNNGKDGEAKRIK
ncbi:MAG TPA: hypothetical protein VFE53_06260 [Mucilaginibacter sp.]|jgi:hypothetical protein|nr:hypothetical protein [Mucilaginibacter sp.]